MKLLINFTNYTATRKEKVGQQRVSGFSNFVKSSFTFVYTYLVQLLKKVSIFLGKEEFCSDRRLTCNEKLGILSAFFKADIRAVEFQSCPSYHNPVNSLLIENYSYTLRNIKKTKIFYFLCCEDFS